MKIIKRTALVAAAAAVTLVLAACGSNSNPLSGGSAAPDSGGPIVVGSANFTESEVLAELYSQALVAKGIKASTKPNIGSREVYIKALQDKSISIVPEYIGNLLLYFDKTSTASTKKEIEAALPDAVGSDLKVLKSSAAADQDVYVVTKQFSEQKNVKSLKDLKPIASGLVLGGPTELQDRAYGPPGLKELYGVTFKEFKPYDAVAVKVKDLNDNKIQVATFFTTESVIADNGYVELEDPFSMILPQNVVPLVRSDVAGNDKAVAALEAVQAALTTEDLTALNKKVDTDRQNAKDVAAEWLKSKGLV
ncbi:ABC transporter substrate-binding protein [Microlunatus panaciterrae]|uniref:Osmoprotectant transport system substrate-binding protein n=1 Tax=Microlunatus panaciterrae TaxID=400768 RepID=A0ABS2RIS4_9ACTN|nr:ABC transporter substrate-binding protein [Microlunatus panaciterrae]MBM7798593.1 osmoprotectant transport system substrate-binding protein [Microlunatus panaciterrae]